MAFAKFGAPGNAINEGRYMMVWNVQRDIQDAFRHVVFSPLNTIGFPPRVYCNNALQPMLEAGLRNAIQRSIAHFIKTWDGCYIIRAMRSSPGSTATMPASLHSWGLAFDINAKENPIGRKPTMPQQLVKCFTDTGLHWGGNWKGLRVDGMHFQVPTI